MKQPSMCPICKQKSQPLFLAPCDYRKPTNSQPYEVYWCDVCNYGYVWGRPTKEEVSSFYKLDDYYTHSHGTISEKNEMGFLDRLRVHISWRLDKGEELTPQEVIPLLKDVSRTILEIGCGNGSNLLKFKSKGFSVTGVEPDPKARSTAKSSGITVFEGTAEELPIEIQNKKYDVILMSHVLEHCLDINAAVSNVRKALKSEGVFIVETPNCESYGFKNYKAEWPFSDIPRHLNFFTPSSLNLTLKKHGFNLVSEKYQGFCRQFSNSWLKNEEEIWRVFSGLVSDLNTKPSFKLRNWKLLLKSCFSSKASKYDSVRLIATKI